VSKKNADQFDW
jgi:hypothetical protein